MKLVFVLPLLIGIVFGQSFAEVTVSLDKSSYQTGDMINVSATISYQEGMFVIIQIRSPSDIVAIDQFVPTSSSFSKSYEANGPKWSESGTYSVKVSYLGQNVEKTFSFTKVEEDSDENTESMDETDSNTQTATSNPIQAPSTESEVEKPKPKVTVKGFPDTSLPPQHYYDRYANESEFKKWFDSVFSGYQLQDIVGYEETYVPGFPDPKNSPQHYIDRYINEPAYQEWFDKVFPGRTIYDVVGVSDHLRDAVSGLVMQYAQDWASEEIDDDQFAAGISELIRQNIISVDEDLLIEENEDKKIPDWFRNIAQWYSDKTITEDEFMFGVQYLVEKQIILI